MNAKPYNFRHHFSNGEIQTTSLFYIVCVVYVCSSSTILDDKTLGGHSDHDEALQSAGLVVKIMSNTRSEA